MNRLSPHSPAKRIELPYGGIIFEMTDFGSASVVSDLHEDADPNVEGGSEEDTAHDRYEAGIDAIESLILAHATLGVDIEAPGYVEGIKTAVEALANNV